MLIKDVYYLISHLLIIFDGVNLTQSNFYTKISNNCEYYF